MSCDHLRVIGCLCFAAIKIHDKLAPRAKKCVFFGYPYAQKGYKLYDLDSESIFLCKDVVFREDLFPYQSSQNTSPVQPPMVNPSLIDDDNNFLHPTIASSSHDMVEFSPPSSRSS